MEKLIFDVANSHYTGTPIDKFVPILDINDKVSYDKVENILKFIGYSFCTCTNYSPVDDVLSIIRGEPYFVYVANESDDRKLITVYYYKHLLSSPVYYGKKFIHGNHYDVCLNVDTGVMMCDKFKFKMLHTNVTTWGYSELNFQAYDI